MFNLVVNYRNFYVYKKYNQFSLIKNEIFTINHKLATRVIIVRSKYKNKTTQQLKKKSKNGL
jgi:hypothetical protein